MLNFTIYTADCVGNNGNCLYPNKMIVTDIGALLRLCGSFRSGDRWA